MLNTALFRLYKIRSTSLRQLVLRLASRFEGGEFHSRTLRRIFREYHNVAIGLYSHGGCFVPGAMDRHTSIGRYCSIARGAKTMNRNHPMDYKSTHAYFFNPNLGYCKEDRIEFTPLSIGNDVWIGANALVLPHAKSIGDGAVIAAGAVVNKDVPPYAVVVGNPARIVRFRFSKEVIEQLLASRWWDKPLEDLDSNEFTKPFLSADSSALSVEHNILANF